MACIVRFDGRNERNTANFPVFLTQVSGKLIRKCALGTELVDWLLNLASIVQTRAQTAGMWQALAEEGALSHGMKLMDGITM